MKLCKWIDYEVEIIFVLLFCYSDLILVSINRLNVTEAYNVQPQIWILC